MKQFFKSIKPIEWIIWSVSVVAVIVSFIAFKNREYVYLVGSLIGITSLVFISKGNPIGQAIILVFAVFYGIASYSFSYYGEMITYLGMSAPIAVWALITWIRNPFKKGEAEVKVNSISKREWILFLVGAAAVTVAFYFILQALGTANLIVSTLSVFTSFSAAYLTARRSRFYALFYALNDIVLVVMWVLASIVDTSYVPMAICFIAFLALDTYGFINWSAMNKRQRTAAQTPDMVATPDAENPNAASSTEND